MGNDLFNYIDRLESMAFFAAYPLVYSIVLYIIKERYKNSPVLMNRLIHLLPLSYALTGILFLGLLLKNMYPNYSLKNISGTFQHSFLKIWGVLALLFWLSFLNKRPILSLLHSFVFFFYLLEDLLVYMFSSADNSMVRNDMKIYTDSLIINTSTFVFLLILYFLTGKLRHSKKEPG